MRTLLANATCGSAAVSRCYRKCLPSANSEVSRASITVFLSILRTEFIAKSRYIPFLVTIVASPNAAVEDIGPTISNPIKRQDETHSQQFSEICVGQRW